MKKIIVSMCALALIGAQTASALDNFTNDSSGMTMTQTTKMKGNESAVVSASKMMSNTGKSMMTGMMKVRTAHLNIRAKATVRSKLVMRLKKGDTVNVTGWSGKWAATDNGFVWGPYLTK